MSRTYDMTRRSNAVAKTKAKIIAATEMLLTTGSLTDLTLQAIADNAGVTVQTVLRHMGSREGCLAAVAKVVSERVDAQRGRSEPGDVDAAISSVLDHYEAESGLVLNLIEQAGTGEAFAAQAVESGRRYHRNWVKRCFGPLVPALKPEITDALVAATDIYTWKLLRLDMGRSKKAASAVMNRLVRGLLEAS